MEGSVHNVNVATALDGRTAIVTGAGNGLGRAEAIALARAGARLVLGDVNGPAVHTVADEIAAAGGQAGACDGGIGDWTPGHRLLSAPLVQFGYQHVHGYYALSLNPLL